MTKLPLCSVCRCGYVLAGSAFDGRPLFRCTGCSRTWTDGADGGESLARLQQPKDRS
jgi:transposase-like protein